MKERVNFAPSTNIIKSIQASRNHNQRLKNFHSVTTIRKIRTSQARPGELTTRESNFRPTTGLGLVSESTGSKTSRSIHPNFSKTSLKSGFKFKSNPQ